MLLFHLTYHVLPFHSSSTFPFLSDHPSSHTSTYLHPTFPLISITYPEYASTYLQLIYNLYKHILAKLPYQSRSDGKIELIYLPFSCILYNKVCIEGYKIWTMHVGPLAGLFLTFSNQRVMYAISCWIISATGIDSKWLVHKNLDEGSKSLDSLDKKYFP